MPLTSEQKSIIFTRLRDGVPIRDIADALGINKKTVLLAKSKIREHGNIVRNPGSGRPKVSTDDEDINLINYLRDNHSISIVNDVTTYVTQVFLQVSLHIFY